MNDEQKNNLIEITKQYLNNRIDVNTCYNMIQSYCTSNNLSQAIANNYIKAFYNNLFVSEQYKEDINTLILVANNINITTIKEFITALPKLANHSSYNKIELSKYHPSKLEETSLIKCYEAYKICINTDDIISDLLKDLSQYHNIISATEANNIIERIAERYFLLKYSSRELFINEQTNTFHKVDNILTKTRKDLIFQTQELISRITDILKKMNIKLTSNVYNSLLIANLDSYNYADIEYTQNQTIEVTLPSELNTQRALKYFARALEKKYMINENGKYQWANIAQRGNKVKFGYFLLNVYCSDNISKLPESAVEKYFNIKRIGSTITQLSNHKTAPFWKHIINEDIFFD